MSCYLYALLLSLVPFLVSSCDREEREFNTSAPSTEMPNITTPTTDLEPGPISPKQIMVQKYEENAYAMSQGKRLYQTFNCNGCHANGGGGMGPALMDRKWIYGERPEQIHATIIEGRPNGMPSFRNRIPEYQVWQLAAYVRSISGLTNKNAAPGRDEHMQSRPPENSKRPEKPAPSAPSRSVEAPQ
jgi:cytochrome c oxidase cbb3-type subunit III